MKFGVVQLVLVVLLAAGQVRHWEILKSCCRLVKIRDRRKKIRHRSMKLKFKDF